jgi:DNA repair protein RecO (recombination protein O)
LNCKKQIQPEDQYFSFELGGVLCPDCGRRDQAARPISLNALKVLRHLQRSSYEEARKAKPSASVQAELEALMNAYLTYLLERALNSPKFLRRVRNRS